MSTESKFSPTPATVSNGVYELSLDTQAGSVTSIKNLASGVTTSFALTWGYYVSSQGGTTYLLNGTAMKSNQASGAYLFRPINQTTSPLASTRPTLTVTQGPLVTEVKQTYASWATHTIRLIKGSDHIEVEWTAGPIPAGEEPDVPKPAPGNCQGWMQTTKCNPHGALDPKKPKENCSVPLKRSGMSGYCQCGDNVKVFGVDCGGPPGYKTCEDACNAPVQTWRPAPGRELVMKYESGIKSNKVFYTDSNGREMMKRIRDGRGPSYPPLIVNEPVAGNYYPVNSMISLDDGNMEMALVTDVSMGGSSMADGELEVMVHRRVMADDHRGVQEPLNETMCGCNDINAAPGSMGAHGHEGDGGCECAGLTMRGISYLIVDTIDNAHETRRKLIEQLNFPPTLAFTTGKAGSMKSSFTALAAELPENIKLVTVSNNYASFNDGRIMLRLAHMYAVDEHPKLSQPVTVSLSKVFAKAGFTVTDAIETTLTGNQPIESFVARRHTWPTMDPTGGKMYSSPNSFDTRFPYNKATSEVTLRPMEVKTFMVKLD
jgi:hypothetical protein